MPNDRPWLALWLRPGAAVEMSVAQGGETVAFAIAIASTLTAAAAALAPPGFDAVSAPFVAAGAAALALVAALGYFLNGWLVNAASHGLGGRGSPIATRSACALAAAPLILGNLVALVAGARAAALGLAAQGIAELWSLALVLTMLARVQGFGRVRAFFGLILGGLLPALVLAVLVRSLLFQPFSTPSSSMAPTLTPGDYFFAAKWEYGYGRASFPFGLAPISGRWFARPPRRGDVVVFRHNGADWVKRVVGMPGEKVQFVNGRLSLDGRTVERRPLPDVLMSDGAGQTLPAAAYEEILPGGVAHAIVQLQGDDGPLSQTAVFEVPPDCYFVLGDNRDNSADSRLPEIGFVSSDDLIGRAAVIFYASAPGHIGASVR